MKLKYNETPKEGFKPMKPLQRDLNNQNKFHNKMTCLWKTGMIKYQLINIDLNR